MRQGFTGPIVAKDFDFVLPVGRDDYQGLGRRFGCITQAFGVRPKAQSGGQVNYRSGNTVRPITVLCNPKHGGMRT
jgi:hypothetical protein